MNIFRDLDSLPHFTNAVVTIGSYDGIHVGHQSILHKVRRIASDVDGESVLITFDPHPRKVLGKGNKLGLLHSLDEKIEICRKLGIHNMVIVPFTKAFADQPPEQYIEDFLVKHFRPAHVVIGYDHRFGKDRAGDIDLLHIYSAKHGFVIEEIDKKEIDNYAISSTKTRNALVTGDIEQANTFLGYPYTLTGTVIDGKKMGRDLGYPTANISLDSTDKLIPSIGIYASTIVIGEETYQGMSYIGFKPSIEEEHKNKVIEVNIFDFDKEIYGEKISLKFHKKIRDDYKFATLQSLKNQLALDKKDTLAYFSDDPKVTIAILNYNGQQYLEAYLPLMLYSGSMKYDIVVIDNASTDDSVAFLEEWHPEVRVIRLQENYGFAEGYNQGMKHVNTEYVAVVNSDIEVSENWLDPLIEVLDKNKNIGAVQPKIRSIENRNHFEYAGACGGYVDYLGYPFCRGRIFDEVEGDLHQYDHPDYIAWASGAAMVVRTRLYKNIGGLDKEYFAHMEEIDFCYRLRACGYRIKVVPESVVYHLGGGTLSYASPRKTFLNFRNSLYTIIKNNSGAKLWSKMFSRFVLDVASILFFLSKRDSANAGSVVKAYPQVWKNWAYLKKQKQKFAEAKARYGIGNPVDDGVYKKSIVAAYFLKGKKHFSDLNIK